MLPEALKLIMASLIVVGLLVSFFALVSQKSRNQLGALPATLENATRFVWNCFLKPHTGDSSPNQQDALESFYKAQASIYDATRTRLLRGREDMLGLVAAQTKQRVESGVMSSRPIWVDVRHIGPREG